MSIIITINSIEKNVGVSNVALTLTEKLNYYTNQKTCLVELDYENPSFSYILERKDIGEKNIESILPYLSNVVNPDDGIYEIIKYNAKSFKNSDIDIIYGRTQNTPVKEEQLKILIEALREMYELVIIDYGDKIIPKIIMDNSDLNLLVVQASARYIEKLSRNKGDFIDKKTQLLMNNCANGITDVSYILREKLKGVNIIGQLPASNTLVQNILRGMINVDKGDYSNKLKKLTFSICKMLDIKIQQKNSLLSKMLGKNEDSSNTYIEQFRNVPLGQILIEKKICTKQQLEDCLDIQAKRLG